MSEEQVSQEKNDMRLLLIAVPLSLLFMAGSIFFMLPIGQKLLGKSLVVTSASGYEIIYKGQTLMYAPSNCVVEYSDDFSHIVVTCKDGSHTTWINGKEDTWLRDMKDELQAKKREDAEFNAKFLSETNKFVEYSLEYLGFKKSE